MSVQGDDMTVHAPPAAPRRVRPVWWSVRRELWEHPAVWVAPMAAAAVGLIGFFVSSFMLPRALRAAARGDVEHQNLLMGPYSMVAFAVLTFSFLVAIFYSLAALHNERRDRSILFWKSLPVSDTTTVLSKAAIPMVVQPLIALAIILAAQAAMFVWSTAVVLIAGMDPALLWRFVDLRLMWVVLPFGLLTGALWHAPMYAWLLLVSGWAKRMTFVWAIAPWLALAAFERIAFGKWRVIQFIQDRVFGGFAQAFSVGGKGEKPVETFADLDPLRIFANPNLWLGLAAAAALLFVAIRLRRSRDPI